MSLSTGSGSSVTVRSTRARLNISGVMKMGMFDSVVARCPRCGGELEFQSKSGECSLATYPVYAVPVEVASGADGTSAECVGCGTGYTLMLCNPGSTVPMVLV